MEQKGKVESEWKYLRAKGNNAKKTLVTKNVCLWGLFPTAQSCSPALSSTEI